jgi:hypothetical protein
MIRSWVLLSVIIALGGCAGIVTGTVSTATYAEPPAERSFTVIAPDSLSLTNRSLTAQIEMKMLERGYVKAASSEAANVAVVYGYSIGQGSMHMPGSPDYVFGGERIQTTTAYPRQFQIAIVDVKRSNLPDQVETLWEGEVYSSGSSRKMSELGTYFIDVLFENYGKNVSDKYFTRAVEE